MDRKKTVSAIAVWILGFLLNVLLAGPVNDKLKHRVPIIGHPVIDGTFVMTATSVVCKDDVVIRHRAATGRYCWIRARFENESPEAKKARDSAWLLVGGRRFPTTFSRGPAFERAIYPEASERGRLIFDVPGVPAPDLLLADPDGDGGLIAVRLVVTTAAALPCPLEPP